MTNSLRRGPSAMLAAVLALAVVGGCSGGRVDRDARDWTENVAAFEREVRALQADLAIPGLAYVIVEDGAPLASNAFGVAQGSGNEAFTTTTPLRIASVTKALTAVVLMQLVEEGRLDLDAPAGAAIPDRELPGDVRIWHLMTHTSEGIVGEEYVYGTNRYAMLGPIIASIEGHGLDEVLRDRVLDRAGMQAYPSPDLGAHAGLVSTAGDMGAFLAALDDGRLLAPSSLERLALPSQSTTGAALPVSLGWFAQRVQGVRVTWSFGQDDPDYSGALMLRLPERKLSLFVLANANVLSDPFRLLMGDVSKSPVAMSFLRLFAFSEPGAPLAHPAFDGAELEAELARLEERTPYRYGDELMGRMLVDLWVDRKQEAQRKFELALSRYGAADPPDRVLHFAALHLPDERGKDAAIAFGARLLDAHPRNRWMLLAQGELSQQRARFDESSTCFRRILELPNQQPDFLNRLFKAWSWMALAQMTADADPAQARVYLGKIIDSGVTGEMREDAVRLMERLEKGAIESKPD